MNYEFIVIPFELKNALELFMYLINIVFNDFLNKFFIVFFDNILVLPCISNEYAQNLQIVFQTLRNNQLYSKQRNCDFRIDMVVLFDTSFPRMEYLWTQTKLNMSLIGRSQVALKRYAFFLVQKVIIGGSFENFPRFYTIDAYKPRQF